MAINNPTAGDDVIIGTNGDDVIAGLAGDDKLEGRSGDDRIRGGVGDDTINAGVGDDTVRGGLGDDLLRGGLGDDKLFGGIGDDTLIGGPGDDLLVGGSGADEYVFGAGFGNDTIKGFSFAEGDSLTFRDGSTFFNFGFEIDQFGELVVLGAFMEVFSPNGSDVSIDGTDVIFDFGTGDSITFADVFTQPQA